MGDVEMTEENGELFHADDDVVRNSNMGDVEMTEENGELFHADDDVVRNSNMWIACSYCVTAIVGVGVLGLPQAMVFLDWVPGVVILSVGLLVTFMTLKQLTRLHEFEVDQQGRTIRYETYYKLGQRAFGPRLGFWTILPLQLVVEVSLDILYTVAAGEAMNRIYDQYTGSCHPKPVHIFVWFAIFAAIQIGLSLREPTFESLKRVVVAAAIMSFCYSTMAWIIVVSVGGPSEPVLHRLPKHVLVDHCVQGSDPFHSVQHELSDRDLVFRAFNAIGIMAFSYAAHNVILEIQSGIPSTENRSSEAEMLRAVKLTYGVVAMCYLPMGIAFYKVYGNQISQNALSFLQYQTRAPKWVITVTNLMLIIHLVGAYQIFGMPVFTLLETWYKTLVKPKFRGNQLPRFSKRALRFSIRTLYIVITTFLAMLFPYFSPLLGFFGGFAIGPTTLFLPCIIWLRIKNPRRWSRDWCLNWVCIVLGVLVMIFATIGGAYVFIKDVKSDKYSLWKKTWSKSTLYSTKNLNNRNYNAPNTWQGTTLHSRCDFKTCNKS